MAVEKRTVSSATQISMLVYDDVVKHSVYIRRECDIRLKRRNTERDSDFMPRLEFINSLFANSIIHGYAIRVDLAVFNYGEGPYRYD